MITDAMQLKRTADCADYADIGAALRFATTLFFGIVLHRRTGGVEFRHWLNIGGG